MNKIKLIVDSTCDLEPEYLEKHDIEVIPLFVSFDNETFLDGVEIQVPQMYQKVDALGKLPKTAARNAEVYLETFKTYLSQGYDILCITISHHFSSTYQSALLAQEECEKGRVRVVDSLNLSTGIGLVILKAVRYRSEGLSLHEIADRLETEIVPHVKAQFVVESLDYLHYGGRCASTAYFFGKMFRIHPEIVVRDGQMSVYRKPRGNMIHAYDELLDMIRSDLDHLDLDCVFITHSIAPKGEEYLYQELSKIVPREKIMVTRAGCVISSHCGPGTIGILYIVKPN